MPLAPETLTDTGSTEPDGVFPRRLLHEHGELVIRSEPRRIGVISTGQLDCATTLGFVPVAAIQGHGTGDFEPHLAHFHPKHAGPSAPWSICVVTRQHSSIWLTHSAERSAEQF